MCGCMCLHARMSLRAFVRDLAYMVSFCVCMYVLIWYVSRVMSQAQVCMYEAMFIRASCICVPAFTLACLCVCMFVCMFACLKVHVYVCMCLVYR